LFYDKHNLDPDKEFIINLYDGIEEIFSYSQILQRSIKVQFFFREKGLKKGDSINLIMENSADFLVIYLAALSIRVVVCPINYNLMPPEISYIINNSMSRYVVVDEKYLGKIGEIKNEIIGIEEIFVFSKKVEKQFNFFNIFSVYSATNKMEKTEYVDEVGLNDKAVIIYTSGTTGYPKGVVLTHANLLADAQAISEWFKFDEKTRTLCILPLFHNNGQVVTFLAPLWAGGSAIMIKGNVSLMTFWDLVARYNATWSSVIPTILSVLLSFDRKRKDDTMQGIICGGSLLPQSVQKEFENKYNVPIYEGYGLTETTSFSCFNPLKLSERKIGSIGKELPINHMEIIDQNGSHLGTDEEGEICIKGYNVFLEYCSLPEKNKVVFHDDWFHSGDYGYKDEDGFFYIKGRKDDLIIKGGENLYPQEIENVVYNHPKIKDCAAIGIEHPTWGEDVIIFIDLRDGQSMNEEDVKKFCEDKIAVFKIPSKVYFINNLKNMNEIPKGPTKKILRNDLYKYYKNFLSKK